MSDKIRKLYDVLTPDERLVLFIEAMANQDELEVQALAERCPKKNYTCRDLAFSRPLEEMFDGAHVVVIEIQKFTITYLLGGFILAQVRYPEVTLSGKTGKEIDADMQTWREEHKKATFYLEGMTEAVRQAKAIWNAWKTVCREKGLEPEKVLAAAQCPLPSVFTEMMMSAETDADKEAEENFLEALRSLWTAKIPA